MNNLIMENAIQINGDASSWEEAIKLAGNLLIDNGLAQGEYVDAMIDNVKKYGPYILVAPRIAMPHASQSSGAIGTGISFVKLSNPVVFANKEDSPVSVIIAVVAADSNKHMETFSKVASILMEQKNLEKLYEANSKEDVLRVFNN